MTLTHCAAALLMTLAAAFTPGAASSHAPAVATVDAVKVTATIPVGQDPVDIAVNPRTHTAYVTNADSGSVSVISTRTNQVTATIPVGANAGAVAVDPQTDRIYVAHFPGGISVINGRTNTVVATIDVFLP